MNLGAQASGWLQIRTYTGMWVATLLLVVTADWLFYGHSIGWGAAAFGAVLLLMVIVRQGRAVLASEGRMLLIAAIGMLVALTIDPNALSITYALLLLLSLTLLARLRTVWHAPEWIGQLAAQALTGPLRIVFDNVLVRRWLRRRPRQSARRWQRLHSWTVPLGLGGVFVGLFAAANPIISGWISEAWSALIDALDGILLPLDALRVVFWIAVAAGVWMLLRARPRPGSALARSHPPQLLDVQPTSWISMDVLVRCLLLFNAIFLVQNTLDSRYMLGGAALPDGMTYAEYAHRGAYPLIVAALLAGVFVMITFRAGTAGEQSRLARWLVYLWLGQTLLLATAAIWRLDLYVAVYSLTRWRVAAGIWMALVAAGLIWIGSRLVTRRSNVWLINANALTAAAVLYACCFINLDGFIAGYNVRHAREMGGAGVPVDLPYLQSLGFESLPALRALRSHASDPLTRQQAATAVNELETELSDVLGNWRAWTLRRWVVNRSTTP